MHAVGGFKKAQLILVYQWVMVCMDAYIIASDVRSLYHLELFHTKRGCQWRSHSYGNRG